MSESGPQPWLSATGDNLPNVIQYLLEQHPERLTEIVRTLSQRVPRLDRVDAETLQDGRLMLLVKDAPFELPVLSKFASDGTLKLLAYLTVLYDPDPAPFIGIEEPENQLHPLLLQGLAEECRQASANGQGRTRPCRPAGHRLTHLGVPRCRRPPSPTSAGTLSGGFDTLGRWEDGDSTSGRSSGSGVPATFSGGARR